MQATCGAAALVSVLLLSDWRGRRSLFGTGYSFHAVQYVRDASVHVHHAFIFHCANQRHAAGHSRTDSGADAVSVGVDQHADDAAKFGSDEHAHASTHGNSNPSTYNVTYGTAKCGAHDASSESTHAGAE